MAGFVWEILGLEAGSMTERAVPSEDIEALPRMTRKQAVVFLRGRGIPVTMNTLNGLCAEGAGPKATWKWGRHYLYEPRELLLWAEGRLQNAS
jgi:hypothetical protein